MNRAEKTQKITFGIYRMTDIGARAHGFTDREIDMIDELSKRKRGETQNPFFSDSEVEFYREIKNALTYKPDQKIDELYAFIPKHLDHISYNPHFYTSQMKQKVAEDQWIDSDKISIEKKGKSIVAYFETIYIPKTKNIAEEAIGQQLKIDFDNNALILSSDDKMKVELNDDFYTAVANLRNKLKTIELETATEVGYLKQAGKGNPTKSNDLQID